MLSTSARFCSRATTSPNLPPVSPAHPASRAPSRDRRHSGAVGGENVMIGAFLRTSHRPEADARPAAPHGVEASAEKGMGGCAGPRALGTPAATRLEIAATLATEPSSASMKRWRAHPARGATRDRSRARHTSLGHHPCHCRAHHGSHHELATRVVGFTREGDGAAVRARGSRQPGP